MIAASALRHGAVVVVTGNAGDFAPTGAAVENPFQARSSRR